MNPFLLLSLNLSPPKNAFYVDVGANHPVRGSLTFALDRRGWKGVCVEPNPSLAALFLGRRNCSLDTRVVADGRPARFVREVNDELSGLILDSVGETDHAAKEAAPFVPTVRLEEVLHERGAPPNIEFLSLDVEGADHLVVSDSLLSKFRFGLVLVERPQKTTAARLFRNGFLFCQHFLFDALFVHSSHPDASRLARNDTYRELPSRCRSPATGKWLGRRRLPGPCRSVFGCCEPL